MYRDPVFLEGGWFFWGEYDSKGSEKREYVVNVGTRPGIALVAPSGIPP